VSTISAHPVRLSAFADRSRLQSLALRQTAADLEEHLRHLRVRCPEVVVPNLADRVHEVRHDLDRLADFVDAVADALRAADASWLARYAAPVANLRGMQLLWRAATGSGSPVGRVDLGVLVARTVGDGGRVAAQGNPFRAFRRRGTNYLADLEQVRLDALLVALGYRPTPATAVAAAISLRMWAELASWDERRRLALGGLRAADHAQDQGRDLAIAGLQRVTSWLRAQFDGTLGDGDPGPVFIPPPLPLPRPLRLVAVDALDRADTVAGTADAAADRAARAARRAAHATAQAVSTASDAVLDTGARAVDALADQLPWSR